MSPTIYQTLASDMYSIATEFLEGLSSEQLSKCSYDFADDDERERWAYTPGIRGGLPFTEMEPHQERQARRLLATGMSASGFVSSTTIMSLEVPLDQREGWQGNFVRDPRLYYVSIFGTPGIDWAWRFDGHHISVSYLILGGEVASMTPMFLGSNPADAPLMGGELLRPLAAEEDTGRELISNMSPSQRTIAAVSEVAPSDIVQSNRPKVEEGGLPWADASTPTDGTYRGRAIRPNEPEILRYRRAAPIGIAMDDLDAQSKEILINLIRHYLGRLPASLAKSEFEKYENGLFSDIHFSWAGGLDRYQPHYYRIQGAELLIEYDNTQNDANHIHSVWRKPDGDFGRDVLEQHYSTNH